MSLLQDRLGRLLPRSRFARSVSILAGGTAAAQLLVILAAPLLTRLYGPEDFGLLAAFAALMAILAVISNLRYQFAIPLPANDLEAAHVLGLCLAAVLGLALLSLVIVALFAAPVAALLHLPALADYLWLLPLGLLLAGIYEAFMYWAIRERGFPVIARTRLYQGLVTVAIQLGGFLLGPLALLLGHVAGNGAGVVGLGEVAVRKRWSLFRRVRPAGLWRAAVRYRRFPLFSTWSGAFNTLSTQVPPLLFAALFSPAAAGLYALAQRVLALPMSVVGQAVSDAFFTDAAEARRSGDLSGLVTKIYEKLVQVAMPPALVLVLAGPQLFALVFGTEWHQAGSFAQWMAPWLLFQFVTSPLSLLFDVLEKQVDEMLFQLGLLLGRVLALFIGYWMGSLILTVALFSLVSALCYVGKLFWLFHLVLGNWRPLVAPLLQAAAWALLLASPLAVIAFFEVTPQLWLSAVGLAAVMIAARYLVLIRAVW
ncbi:lipopolysaccharide biosynthesis protein [Aquibaculum sediminis]|uniref:lipopolysaccharide biosynthesis protein n=1 Tax=Aquibaculum sediminis TaxID=3231907 RepID=UPI003452726F